MANHSHRPALFRNLVPLVLASGSPRRRDLLAALGLSFEVVPAGISEEISGETSALRTVTELSRRKARAVAERFPERAILAADTVVVCEGRILGKPRHLAQAREMLSLLSGRWHEVYTGVALRYREREDVFFTCTRVRFRNLSPEEIEAYLATGEPLGKAGAYAIQGLASALVVEVQGSVTGVIGLPLAETVELLRKRGIIAPGSG